jgi:hypothetical protein
VVTPFLKMTVRIPPITIIADGMAMPIRMASDPDMKTVNSEGIGMNPDITRAQIIILIADHADILITVPDIIVRHFHHCGCRGRYRRRLNHDRRRSRDH